MLQRGNYSIVNLFYVPILLCDELEGEVRFIVYIHTNKMLCVNYYKYNIYLENIIMKLLYYCYLKSLNRLIYLKN